MPVSGRISVPLGRAEGKGWVPYVHPAKVAELEAEVERLRSEFRRVNDRAFEHRAEIERLREDYETSHRGRLHALEEVERLRKALATETTRRATILRVTYAEDMPDHLANHIRSLCAR